MQNHVISRGDAVVSTVIVGRDLSDTVAEAVTSGPTRRVAVLSQPTTTGLSTEITTVLTRAGVEVSELGLPDGEDAKRMTVVEDAYRSLNRAGFSRDDMVLGVGGGALTDVAGFIAATYLRGIRAVNVPTTLLGAVDAAIGGKTAINVDGKNLAGVFAHPQAVIIDMDVIDALPPREKIIGAAEAIKTGFIADTTIVEMFEAKGIDADLEEIVNRSVQVKVGVVNEDFTEQGKRAILNYGHTIGHAIESSTGRPHGEAVSIGMVAAGYASQHLVGFNGAPRQEAILAKLGLPVRAPEAKLQDIRSLMDLDKKRDSKGMRMVLLEDFGTPVVIRPDDATVQAAFAGIDLKE